ncbi:hypothetical protein JIR001_26420 [Polycladomyces abyssicola]|uniref:Uncharacterized protein n=1 Tax=Polycladomyces abyssicola TaxID=1125966 RepID=A0A8D5ZLT3_9BACL|nr:hypothetical protein [Polycladomyces abyssicola]BCU82859.1 hypothetical protein JIR001_26420 [Polycladomyces abyssicola]
MIHVRFSLFFSQTIYKPSGKTAGFVSAQLNSMSKEDISERLDFLDRKTNILNNRLLDVEAKTLDLDELKQRVEKLELLMNDTSK